MKKILFFILLSLISLSVISQTGTGWAPVNYKPNFRDSVNFAKQFRLAGTTITVNALEMNVLDGVLANTSELNRLVGVDSLIQTQLDKRAFVWNPTFYGTAVKFNSDTLSTQAYTRAHGGGGGSSDTTHLSDRIDLKLNKTDTTGMLGPYALLSEVTSGGWWGSITGDIYDQTDLNDSLDRKIDTTRLNNILTSSLDTLRTNASELNVYAPLWTDTLNKIATKNDLLNIIGGGGSGGFEYLSGNVDQSGWPGAGDSVLTHTHFIGKHVIVWRESGFLQQHPDNTVQDGFKFNNTTGAITFRPVLGAGEQIEVWAANNIYFTELSPEGGGGVGESPLLDSLIVGYKLDEPTGTVAYDVNNVYNSTVIEGTVNQAGKFGVSVGLNGSSNDISVMYNDALIPSGSTMSVSLWVYLNTLPSTLTHPSTLWAADHTGPTIWVSHSIGITNTGDYPRIGFYNTTGTEFYAQSAVALTTGQWYHIVGVCKANGSPVELWVNGAKVASGGGNFTGTLFQPASYITFGNDGPVGTYGTAGYIDDVYIFEQALSYEDIQLLYNSGAGRTHPFN
jgi:hypothetical protein